MVKVINWNRRRRGPYAPGVGPAISEEEAAKPRKKALLIGIGYKKEGPDGKLETELKFAHDDVAAMKNLLLRKYDYDPKDIVTLLDQDGPPDTQPTRQNLLRQCERMVYAAQPGDSFFFHYTGHTCQIENKNNSEEDGLDECIVPCDEEAGVITDNELRRRLVDSLPIGSQLIAVFDSCHSHSLLDLEHYRCNRVYVPWINKGKRRSDPRWNRNIRRLAMVVRDNSDDQPTEFQTFSRRISQYQRTSANLRSRQSSIDQVISGAQKGAIAITSSRPTALSSRSTPASRAASRSASRAPSKPTSPTRSRAGTGKLRKRANTGSGPASPIKSGNGLGKIELPVRGGEWFSEGGLSPIQRTTSPTEMFPCTGSCSPAGTVDTAEVISLSSCKDSQLSWEETSSMTQTLIQILESEPHPSFKNLMLTLSHSLHSAALNMHNSSKRYKFKLKQWKHAELKKGRSPSDLERAVPEKLWEMDNFQDPQLASRRPLNMDARWPL